MLQKMLTLKIAVLSVLSSSLLLTACGHREKEDPDVRVVIRENYIVAKPDDSLRSCQARPARPQLKDDTDVAVLIADLDERGEDCSSKLSRTWQSIDEAKAEAERLNERN